tara:strand:+ start:22 stop:498 length:477 start_codon:yes stop_codon:yes gene_type:complete
MAIDYAKGLSDNPIIQVVSGTSTTQSSTSSSSFQNGFQLSIVPHHSSNKIIVMGTGMISMGGGSTMGGIIKILRSDGVNANVNISGTGDFGHGFCGATNYDMDIVPSNGFIYVDAPGSTNTITYTQQFRTTTNTVYYNKKQYANRPGKASFVLIEVVA